jgi:hypothetical protein
VSTWKHQLRWQQKRDHPQAGQEVVWVLGRRRFRCQTCWRTFTEPERLCGVRRRTTERYREWQRLSGAGRANERQAGKRRPAEDEEEVQWPTAATPRLRLTGEVAGENGYRAIQFSRVGQAQSTTPHQHKLLSLRRTTESSEPEMEGVPAPTRLAPLVTIR